ncbi:unnamed protein product, partial [Meganyctiphanes norvegica]
MRRTVAARLLLKLFIFTIQTNRFMLLIFLPFKQYGQTGPERRAHTVLYGQICNFHPNQFGVNLKCKILRTKLVKKKKKNNVNIHFEKKPPKLLILGVLITNLWARGFKFLAFLVTSFFQYVNSLSNGKSLKSKISGLKRRRIFIKIHGSTSYIYMQYQLGEDIKKLLIKKTKKTYIILFRLNKQRLHQLVTERAYPLMVHKVKNKTIRWNFIKSLEPPHVVHVRNANIVTDDNIFAQVTIRFHTKQTLAIYDRFGRIQHGSEVVAKDVLEYVVFEKHIANTYGVWRIHDKIIPDWMPPRTPVRNTYRVEEEPVETEAAAPAPTEAASDVDQKEVVSVATA